MWVKELRKMLGKEIVLAIAGNKIDRERIVSLSEAEEFARSVGAKHYNTSAKLNEGVTELFLDLAKSSFTKLILNIYHYYYYLLLNIIFIISYLHYFSSHFFIFFYFS